MLPVLFLICLACFILGYRFYGAFLRRRFGLDDSRPTPAVEQADGVDYCAARTPVLFGHHFSSIAGAGPIVGPVLAGIAFGWLPALIWVVLGAIFVGGVHDMGSLAASIRHKACSVAEIARENITPLAGKLFLIFIWLALILVLAAFIDLTASTFVADGGVATSSGLYILLALAFGFLLYRMRIPLALGTLVFVPLVFAAIWLGQQAPVAVVSGEVAAAAADPDALKQTYVFVLAAYCFAASILPVWLLLQPRDYLSSFLLYGCLAGGSVGLVLSGHDISYPALQPFHHESFGYLVPALFITVACGACSGFHSIVASGTTAKQLPRETAAQPVGYGGMLTEGVLAVVALAAVMVCAEGSGALQKHPTQIFAAGLGRFMDVLGIPESAGATFGLLAISTFLLTTLDTATRLARYVAEELLGRRDWIVKMFVTAATLGLPLLIVSSRVEVNGVIVPAYKLIWPLFGSTNQLLAGLALLTITVWLKRSGTRTAGLLVSLLPMVFMIGVTLLALGQILLQAAATGDGLTETANAVKFGAALLLLLLALVLIFEAVRSLRSPPEPESAR